MGETNYVWVTLQAKGKGKIKGKVVSKSALKAKTGVAAAETTHLAGGWKILTIPKKPSGSFKRWISPAGKGYPTEGAARDNGFKNK